MDLSTVTLGDMVNKLKSPKVGVPLIIIPADRVSCMFSYSISREIFHKLKYFQGLIYDIKHTSYNLLVVF